MGLFGGDNDDQESVNAELQARIDNEKLQLEQQKDMLIASRLSLIKNQGMEQWTPDQTNVTGRSLNNKSAVKQNFNPFG